MLGQLRRQCWEVDVSSSAKHTENSVFHVIQRWRSQPGRSSIHRDRRNPLTIVDHLTIWTRGPRRHVARQLHRMSAFGMAGSMVRTHPLLTNLTLLFCTSARHNVSSTTSLNTRDRERTHHHKVSITATLPTTVQVYNKSQTSV